MVSLVTVSEIRNYLQIVSDDKATSNANLQFLANYASSVIQSYCGRELTAAYVVEYKDGGKAQLFVDRIPINSINSVMEYSGSQYVELRSIATVDGELPNLVANANAVSDFTWDKDTGKISKDVALNSGNPHLSLLGVPTFANYAKGVRIEYNGGYTTIPDDLKLATLDYVKMLYKKEQAGQVFALQGESKQSFPLSQNNFPPHIRRILDLYRILW